MKTNRSLPSAVTLSTGGVLSLTALKEDRINRILLAVKQELFKGMQLHQAYNSAHEAYSVILEELDEFWDEVRKKRQDRSQALMSRELIQVAATSLRTIFDLTSQYQDAGTKQRVTCEAKEAMAATPACKSRSRRRTGPSAAADYS